MPTSVTSTGPGGVSSSTATAVIPPQRIRAEQGADRHTEDGAGGAIVDDGHLLVTLGTHPGVGAVAVPLVP